MNTQSQQLIETLAAKLGTTAAYLWSVLVRQAPISGFTNLAICGLLAALTAWWFRVVKIKTHVPPKTETERFPEAEWEGDETLLAWASVVLAGTITITIIACNASDIVSAFANPEYWALMRLLGR